jgi:hypothetical protein
MKNLVIFFFCIIQSLALLAHQDTPIKLKDDGTLKGLPEQYSNPTFDLNTLTLCIGENKIIIPECVKSIFMDDQIYLNHISASWYHDPEFLPHYIHIDINGYEIFFNLETLEIFQIWRPEMLFKDNQENKYEINEQEISDECQTVILKSITKR